MNCLIKVCVSWAVSVGMRPFEPRDLLLVVHTKLPHNHVNPDTKCCCCCLKHENLSMMTFGDSMMHHTLLYTYICALNVTLCFRWVSSYCVLGGSHLIVCHYGSRHLHIHLPFKDHGSRRSDWVGYCHIDRKDLN